MGFLTKIENSREPTIIKSKEELRRHNASVIKKYKESLEVSEKKFLSIEQNDISSEEIESEIEYNESPQNGFIFNNTIEVPEIQIPIETTDKIEDKKQIVEDLSEEQLMQLFEKETGKNAIWRGKITKNYLSWREIIEKGN